MSPASPTLHMLCGKIAAGKSTLAARLGRAGGTVLVVEDDWLNALFSGELSSISDYALCSRKLRAIMGPHVTSILNAGVSVVLDLPANTVETRNWMRGILDGTNASHRLHLLAASDETCLARLRRRNAEGEHPFSVSEAHFIQFSKHYVPPSPDEGFHVVVHEDVG